MSITLNGTEGVTLDNGSADGAQVTLKSSGYSDWNLDNYSGRFRAYYNATERFTIDTSGNVGIGTNSPNTKVDSSQSTGFNYSATRTSSSGYNGLSFYENTTNTSYIVEFGSGAGGGQRLQMWTNTAFPIAFGTNNTERMRIDSSGNVLVGTTDSSLTTGNGFKVLPALSGAGTPGVMINTAGSNSSNSSLFVYSTGASAYRFYVRNDGAIFATNTTVQSISDERLKENIRPLEYGLEQILSLQPRRFDWKDGKGLDKKDDIGFIAQEFEQVVPEFIDESLDQADDGSQLKTVGATGLIPVLVKAIQEQQELIKSLTSRIEILEAK